MNRDIQKIDRMLTSPIFRIVLPVAIIAMYVVGIFLMIFSYTAQGLGLWFFSTVFGALQLYVKRTQEKKKADFIRIEEEEREYQRNKKEQEQNSNANA